MLIDALQPRPATVRQSGFDEGQPVHTGKQELLAQNEWRTCIDLKLLPQAQYEALKEAREHHASAEGKQEYARRAGIEGTLSQGVRAFGLRATRYWGESKTHLQHVATAAAINVDRIVNWLDDMPRAQTRTSGFAALAA
jgi:transposase